MLSESDPADGSTPPTFEQVLLNNQVVTPAQLRRLRSWIEQRGKQQIPGYRLVERLGSGSMGTVYKAIQLSLDRTVAIKVLNLELTRSEAFVKRFHDEGRIAAKLNHPNIIAAIDVGHSGEYHYFVMEYVQGRTVQQMLDEDIDVEEQEAVRIMHAVARGLAHAHAAGLIHRDVKPSNIMIGQDGVAKLADMGLAQFASADEPQQQEKGKRRIFGTPYYMSPEQIRSLPDLDFRTDLYSFGATFYHMVTGRVPFDAPDPVAVMRKHLGERYELPESVNPRLSTGVSQVIQACMKRRREKRYAATTELVGDLEALASMEEPLHAQSLLGMLH
jgi:serine/threonine protein kinase